jgi:hypothetical protein
MRDKPTIPRTCEQCGAEFLAFAATVKKGGGKFCCRSCHDSNLSARKRAAKPRQICEMCGKAFVAQSCRVKVGLARFCSRACHAQSRIGQTRATPQNGRTISSAGYVVVLTDVNQRRYEHRLVMERILGRPLARNEVVHHIDGNKQNNLPENLRVLTPSEHTLLHGTQGRWSKMHDCCVECGGTKARHIAHGLCATCDGRKRSRARRQK